MIYKINQYVDSKGRQVIHKAPVRNKGFFEDNKMDYDDIIYIGLFNTFHEDEEIQIHFEFPNGYSLEQCFEELDEIGQKEYEKLLEK